MITPSLGFIFISGLLVGSHQIILPNAYAEQTSANTANNNTVTNSTGTSLPTQEAVSPSATKDLTFAELYARTKNSVVQVTSILPSIPNFLSPFGGNNSIGERAAVGSGFVIDKQGHIVTNNHVVADAVRVTVTFSDGTVHNANISGTDPFSDIAVLTVRGNITQEKLIPLPLANSSALAVGDEVAAIGNPFGLTGSFTTGVISGLGRLLPEQAPNNNSSPAINMSPVFSIPNIIQTDAVINPGNSGGPLLDMQGEVIGMNTAILSISSTASFSGVGFAVPSNSIRTIAPALIMNGTYTHPWLGISGTEVTPEIATRLGLKEAKGVLIIDIAKDSPADSAGLRGGDIPVSNFPGTLGQQLRLGGDIIMKVDGREINKIDDLLSYIESGKKVGESITLTVMRDGKMTDVNLVLGARPR
jgi:serine protease Do